VRERTKRFCMKNDTKQRRVQPDAAYLFEK